MAHGSGEPRFLLLKTPLSPSESANILGRVVRRYDALHLDYTPNSPATTLTPAQFARFFDVHHIDDARLTAHASSTSSGFADFFARAAASTTAEATATVTAPRITIRQLQQQADYFSALKADPEVRRKLLDMCPVNDTVYLVVGTMSARQARIERSTRAGRTTGGGARFPVGAAAAVAAQVAAGVPPVVGSDLLGGVVPDAEAGYERTRLAGGTASFDIAAGGGEGEVVFAVACRVIRRTWRGLGNDVRVGTRQPEYTGGVHFGEEDSDDSGDEDGDAGEAGLSEADEMALAEGLELGELAA